MRESNKEIDDYCRWNFNERGDGKIPAPLPRSNERADCLLLAARCHIQTYKANGRFVRAWTCAARETTISHTRNAQPSRASIVRTLVLNFLFSWRTGLIYLATGRAPQVYKLTTGIYQFLSHRRSRHKSKKCVVELTIPSLPTFTVRNGQRFKKRLLCVVSRWRSWHIGTHELTHKVIAVKRLIQVKASRLCLILHLQILLRETVARLYMKILYKNKSNFEIRPPPSLCDFAREQFLPVYKNAFSRAVL